MATRSSYLERSSYLYLGGGGGGGERVNPINSNSGSEFNEAEIWNSDEVFVSEPPKKSIHTSRPMIKKPMKKSNNNNNNNIDHQRAVTAASLPVNIPDWEKILGSEYKNRRRETERDDEYDDDDDDDDQDGKILPPHEYLARVRGSSFSVHEGIKGRYLSRVRNAIWKQTGFAD